MRIIGHEKQWRFLKQSAELGKISHAYLFCGQEKLGKKTIALRWISLITGCPFQKQHPDFVLIEPENNTIQISQIRDLIWRLSLKSSLIPIKVALIDKAHLMGTASQHALLKTLEEPKGEALLILITEKPELLFPTILSRCEIVKFNLVEKSEIKNYLKEQGVSEKEAEGIASISRGRPGEAIDLILNPPKLEKRKKIIKEFSKISKSPLFLRFQYAKDLSQKENLQEILEIWLSFLRQNLLAKINKNSNSTRQSLSKLKNTISFLEKINFLISSTNINSRLALEILMMEL